MNPEREYSQVCVWPGTLVGNDVEGFVAFMKKEFGVRVEYLEEIVTQPNTDDLGNPVENTGGRNDLFFAVHQESIPKFAVKRLVYGIRWIEDVLSNHSEIYPERIFEYRSW